MDINEFAVSVHENSVDKGWYEVQRPFSEIVAMCHTELSEAMNCHRDGEDLLYFRSLTTGNKIATTRVTEEEIEHLQLRPEGAPIELVDCVLRIFDYLVSKGHNVEELMTLKHNFNLTRDYRHGGRKC